MIQKQAQTLPDTPDDREAPGMDAADDADGADRTGAADDAALVRAAQADPVAFGQLYQAYRDRVYWYLLARTGNRDDAADLTQHVFLKALDALAQYQPKKGPFVAWLFGVARNAATNLRQRSRPTVAWDYVTDADVSAQSLEDAIVRRESLDQLRRLCATLDPTKQELLALRFVGGLTSAEIAAVIGKSEAATKRQLSRIIQSLKERYHDIHDA
jgi:RNA polymerase sigma-70 factor (ECF subfamily)